MEKTVTIRLNEEEYRALCRLARAQVRKVSGQARWYVVRALEEAGELIQAEDQNTEG
jgi:predicted transcriptional regulator